MSTVGAITINGEPGSYQYNERTDPWRRFQSKRSIVYGKFWRQNFGKHPDFKPNYIVPNKCSIMRCLSESKGFAVIPDFLCREEIRTGKVKMVWEGNNPIENTLYFGTRKKTIYAEEIRRIEEIFLAYK